MKFPFFNQTEESMNDPNRRKIEFVGIMGFFTGEFYIGEFDKDFKFEGEGQFFFSIGASLRGNFKEGKVHGHALFNLPNNILIKARLDRGIFNKESLKMDLENG